jgi:histidinol-phosphatase (PHP family)
MPHSHHSHSGQFCAHGSGSLESVIQEAIKQKFTTYGLTEHVPRYHRHELYPEEIEAHLGPEQLAAQFDAFIVEAHRLKELYADRICLLVGAETELIDLDEDVHHLQALLEKHGSKIGYLVGSIHHVNGIPIDFDRATYEKAVSSLSLSSGGDETQLESFFRAYFDAQYRLMTSLAPSLDGRPFVIGHIDLCRLYTPDITITSSYPSIRELIVRNIQFAVEHGMIFEANAAAFRKGWATSYPGRDVLDVNASVFYNVSLHVLNFRIFFLIDYLIERGSIRTFR